MRRATIIQTDTEVSIKYYDTLTGEQVTRTFWVPCGGGYVRDEFGRQICVGLASRGPTLHAKPDDLLALIRRHWRLARRVMQS